MPDGIPSHRVEVLIVTADFHVRGSVVAAPDGSMLELEHISEQPFVRVFDAEFLSRVDGRRVYDAREAFVNKNSMITVFRQSDIAFIRRPMSSQTTSASAAQPVTASQAENQTET